MDDLVARLKAIFSGWPASLRTPELEKNYRKEFLKAMAQFGIANQNQIERGLVRARREAEAGERYLPSGATFAGWCKQTGQELGLPDFETAYETVIFGEWKKLPEAFQVIFSKHRYELKVKSEASARKRFKEIYDAAVKRVASGEIIKWPERKQIQSPSGTVHTRKTHDGPTGKDALNNLLAMVGSSKARS